MYAQNISTEQRSELAATLSEIEVRVSTVRRLSIALLDSGGLQETADLALAIDAIGETIEQRICNMASVIALPGPA